ncbi:MAG: DUF4785 family protein [Litorilituus sp.]|nr:DUF4785 family protein [Litorilituus sp.]
MKRIKLINILSALALFILAFQLNAKAVERALPIKNTLSLQTINFFKSKYDLVTLANTDDEVEKKAIHFSQKLAQTATPRFTNKGYSSVSDEYWFEVTGAQLKKGIAVSISEPGALIRLSGKSGTDKGLVSQNTIDPNSVQLFKNNKKLTSAFSQKVTAQQLATANIFPNSSALKLDSRLGTGNFILKVDQNITERQRFLVNVKEKNARHKLNLSIKKQSYLLGQDIYFSSAIKGKNQFALKAKQKASIKLPSGKMVPVTFAKKGKHFKVQLPEVDSSTKRGQLYELYIEASTVVNNIQVKRNAKVAFAVSAPTAKLHGKLVHKSNGANLNLEVASEGRYELSGLIYGMNNQGRHVPFMMSRSAYFLPPGNHKLLLHYDKKIIKSSGLKPPYLVKNLQLVDQSRLALLQQF